MSAKVAFKESDINRAISGCRKAGLHVGRVEIEPGGKIVVFTDEAEPTPDWRRKSKLYET